MGEFIFQIIWLTVWQLIIIFGGLFVFGLILAKLQKWTHSNYQKSIGWKGILWTAWLGTPIHEFSHILFAKIFRHKIISVKLFQPDPATGELGCVNHGWKEKSIYQNIGNFFIAVAPVVFGSIILVILLLFLVPNGQEVFTALSVSQFSVSVFFTAAKGVVAGLFSQQNIVSPSFWLFLYVSFCIASHMNPSPQDRKGMWHGLLFIFFILLFFNIFALILQFDSTQYVLRIISYFGIFVAIFSYAIAISFIHFLFSVILLLLFGRATK